MRCRGLTLALLVCGATVPRAAAGAAPTYNRDIAPLVWARCGSCHRPGDLAPFSLLDYRDVRPRARQILEATAARRMPPWLPDEGPPFAEPRRLTDAEQALIRAWVEGGAVEGAPADLSPRPEWHDGWQLGTPDLVVEASAPYVVPPGTGDLFRNLVLPVPIAAGRWVRGIEIDPGNRRIVHHAALAIDRTNGSRRRDALDAEPGFAGGMVADLSASSPQGRALGWTPGMTPAFEPPGMAWRLEPGSDLVLLMHVMPGGRPETLRPRIALYFSDTPPDRSPIDLRLGSKAIDIPPHTSGYVVEDRLALPVDVDLLSIYPHAHYLATRMVAVATLPDGSSRALLSIRDWDFRWQEQYRYAQPISLPRGTVITMRYVYDNSPGRRQSPNAGEAAVRYGPLSSDEMGDLWLRVVPRNLDDAQLLVRASAAHELQKDLVLARQRVLEAPGDAAAQLLLGVSLLEAGQPEAALAPLRAAVQRLPGNPLAHLNLGNAFSDLGQPLEAIAFYERALALSPEAADVHNNLGIALGALGRVDEAIAHFQEALRIQPGYADAQRNLEVARALRGR